MECAEGRTAALYCYFLSNFPPPFKPRQLPGHFAYLQCLAGWFQLQIPRRAVCLCRFQFVPTRNNCQTTLVVLVFGFRQSHGIKFRASSFYPQLCGNMSATNSFSWAHQNTRTIICSTRKCKHSHGRWSSIRQKKKKERLKRISWHWWDLHRVVEFTSFKLDWQLASAEIETEFERETI